MDRDHQVRALIPWVMERKQVSREEAKDLILRFPPEARKAMFRLRGKDRGLDKDWKQ